MLKQLILIRHPEVEWKNIKNPESSDSEGRLMGSTDVPLSKTGQAHAKRIAYFLKNLKPQKIYSSPLIRANTTAKLINGVTRKKILNNDLLKEINFGNCEGMTFNNLSKKFPDIAKKYLDCSLDIAFPQGESLSDFRKRIGVFADTVIKKENGIVVVVTHGGVIRSLLCHLLGLDDDFIWKIKQDYGAINILSPMGNGFIIERLNYTTKWQK